MFFVLSKVIAFLTVPITWMILLAVYAVVTKRKERRRKAVIGITVMFLFFSNPIIFDEFMRHWEIPGKQAEDVEEVYDVGIVLGGMVFYNKDLDRISFHRGSDRIWQAVDLYRRGIIKKILISGASGNLDEDGLLEAKQLKEFLVHVGLPEEDIITEETSRNTHENAAFTVALLNEEYPDYDSFLLITSGFHMRRARACFEKEGLTVDCYSTDLYTGDRWFNFDRLFVPHIETLQNWKTLNHEWSGYLVYRVMGYL